MNELNPNQINEVISELLSDIENKENQPPQPAEPQITEPKQTESQPTEPQKTTEPQETKPTQNEIQVDMKQMNKLFSGLIKSFIPKELKENNDVKKMFDVFFPVEENEKEPLDESLLDKESGKDEESCDELNEESSCDELNEESSEDELNEESSEEELNECDEEENKNHDCMDFEYKEEDKYIYVVSKNNEQRGYASSFKKAERYMNHLYQDTVRRQCNSFLKTERSIGHIVLYERKAFTLFPFQDTLLSVFTIKMVPKV